MQVAHQVVHTACGGSSVSSHCTVCRFYQSLQLLPMSTIAYPEWGRVGGERKEGREEGRARLGLLRTCRGRGTNLLLEEALPLPQYKQLLLVLIMGYGQVEGARQKLHV